MTQLEALRVARELIVEMRGYMDRLGQQGIRERVDAFLADAAQLTAQFEAAGVPEGCKIVARDICTPAMCRAFHKNTKPSDVWEVMYDAAPSPQPVKQEGWQPIETAPKDGTWIQLTGGSIDYSWDGRDAPKSVVGQYSAHLNGGTVDGHWQFAWYDGGYYGLYEKPTHWMPLPQPPESEE